MKRAGNFSPNTSPVKKIDSNTMALQQIQASLASLTAKINGVDLAIKKLQSDFDTIQALDKKVSNIDTKMAFLEREVEALQRQALQKTLRISGVADKINETREELLAAVTALLDDIKLPQIQIVTCRRVGKHSTKPRAIIVELTKLEDKFLIFSNKKHLKGKKIYINQALTKTQSHREKLLRDHGKTIKATDISLKCFVRNGRLMVIATSGVKSIYTIDDQLQLQQLTV